MLRNSALPANRFETCCDYHENYHNTSMETNKLISSKCVDQEKEKERL
jgi:hypothetical protein